VVFKKKKSDFLYRQVKEPKREPEEIVNKSDSSDASDTSEENDDLRFYPEQVFNKIQHDSCVLKITKTEHA
jgi:hypothetical protein